MSFDRLRKSNDVRMLEWNTSGEDLGLSFAGNELAGEVGEACNIMKKLERERLGLKTSKASVADLTEELADVIICVDLIATRFNIDLEEAVANKFNKTSEKYGLESRY